MTVLAPLSIVPFETASAARQMALDLLWMEHIPAAGAIFRHYAWAESTATYGYFQPWQQVKSMVPDGWTLQRRPTAGGLVLHPNGFTYTLLVSQQHPWYRLPASETYRQLHAGIVEALGQVGVAASLVESCGDCNAEVSAIKACQQQPVLYDVLDARDQQKLAGAALKRNRHGLLFQGHLWAAAYPVIQGQDFVNRWTPVLEKQLRLTAKPLSITTSPWSAEQERQCIQELQSVAWQQRR